VVDDGTTKVNQIITPVAQTVKAA